VLGQLERDSGLCCTASSWKRAEDQRLAQALTTQQQRYLATSEREQVYLVGDAIRELAKLIGLASAIAGAALDIEMLEVLPSLDPLLPSRRVAHHGTTAYRDAPLADWPPIRPARSARRRWRASRRPIARA
jgi:hypothetical protein